MTVSYRAGWIGEGQVSYGVPGASERARLAGQIVLDRLEPLGVRPIETRTEVVGVDSTFVPRDLIRPSVTVHEICARASVSPQPFTAPAVRPETIRRWNTSTRITSGRVITIEAAVI